MFPCFSVIAFCNMSVLFLFCSAVILPATFVSFAIHFPNMLKLLLSFQNVVFRFVSVMFVLSLYSSLSVLSVLQSVFLTC